jgi:hypothetical protein
MESGKQLNERTHLGGSVTSMAASNRARERGRSKLNLILTLAVLGAMLFIAVKIVPVYFANYELKDSIETEARFAIANRRSDDDIRDAVFKKVQELGVPAKREDIKVNNQQRFVEITVDYTVPIDLQVYQFPLQFHLQADNRTL